MLKHANPSVYHRLSPKHLQRYVNMFAGRQDIREMDTFAQMRQVVGTAAGIDC